MAAKLKVFRTPIGFHDAYVAAPSQKAALEAWGADVNLFARGAAEQVSDPDLMRAALAKPGTVIKVTRGSADEHLAALPASGPGENRARASRADGTRSPAGKSRSVKPRPPKPRPSRDALDAAEAALADQRRAVEREIAALEEQRNALARRIDAAREKGDADGKSLEARLRTAQRAYENEMDRWRRS